MDDIEPCQEVGFVLRNSSPARPWKAPNHESPPRACHCEEPCDEAISTLVPELALSSNSPTRLCRVGSARHSPSRQIGFVFPQTRIASLLLKPFWHRQLSMILDEIGFVLHVSLSGRATPHMTAAFAHIPQSLQVWLRFAQFPPSPACGGAKLGSFRTMRPQIGFVLHNRPTPPGPRATRPRRELGSFCANRHHRDTESTQAQPEISGPEVGILSGMSVSLWPTHRILPKSKERPCTSQGRPHTGRTPRIGAAAPDFSFNPQSRPPAGSPFTPFSPSHFSNLRLHRRPRPPSYRRLSRPVCCAKTKNSTNISLSSKKSNVPFPRPVPAVQRHDLLTQQ
jgi:hypothetical protein